MLTRYKIIYFSSLYGLLLLSLFFSLFSLAPLTLQEVSAAPSFADNSRQTLSTSGSNYLFLGIDNTSHSSDVIMLAHIDQDGKNMKLLQIPRDSYAAGYGKINSIFSKAYVQAKKENRSEYDACLSGADALASHLSLMLGITIDCRAVLTLSDFRVLIDSVGGVPITLPQDLDYEDPAQGLSIHLKQGEQVLDGKSAEGLVRCRNAYPTADYGRMDAQKLFLSALFEKLRYHTSPFQILGLIRKAHRYIKTDLTLSSTLSLGKKVLSAKDEHLYAATLVGKTLTLSSGMVEILPADSVKAASLWLEGNYSEDNALKACVGTSQKALLLYQTPAEIPFTPRVAKEKN